MTPEPPSMPSRLLDDVRSILRDARGKTYAAANAAMVDAYWPIGRRIVEEEQGGEARAEYGAHLIRNIARALGEEFGKGMSVANLRNFRQFYLTFPDAEKSYALRSELSWTHWRLIMRVENPQARDYYIGETARQQLSSRALERIIETHTFHRLLKAPEAEPSGIPSASPNPLHLLKDPYLLKCFVLIDLKTVKLSHADIGQMDMYVRMFDDLRRGADDNPTLGIILCADKDETLVRYSVLSESQQLFASKYRLLLPSEEELQAELERRHILDWPEPEGGEKP